MKCQHSKVVLLIQRWLVAYLRCQNEQRSPIGQNKLNNMILMSIEQEPLCDIDQCSSNFFVTVHPKGKLMNPIY